MVSCREKAGVNREELRYYVSNQVVVNQRQADELFDAIRGHWSVEVMHHKRDVTFSESDRRCGRLTKQRSWGQSAVE